MALVLAIDGMNYRLKIVGRQCRQSFYTVIVENMPVHAHVDKIPLVVIQPSISTAQLHLSTIGQ